MKRFNVSIHDVCPTTIAATREIVAALRPLVGRNLSLAIIPHRPADDASPGAIRAVADEADEFLLHGLTHRRERSFDAFSWLIGRNDEFAALDLDETRDRLRAGIAILKTEYAIDVAGTLPPAWRGPCVHAALADSGLQYVVGFASVQHLDGRRVSLATTSWDPGPLRWLWPMCELLGRLYQLRRAAVPCVCIHPVDLSRGVLPRAINLIRHHLDAGRSPSTFAEMLEDESDGARVAQPSSRAAR